MQFEVSYFFSLPENVLYITSLNFLVYLLSYLFRQYWWSRQALSYTIMLGAVGNLVLKMVKGTAGLSCCFMLWNPRHMPCSQNSVNTPGDNVGWPREYFLHSSSVLHGPLVLSFDIPILYLPVLGKIGWDREGAS